MNLAPLPSSRLLERVRDALPGDVKVYLVGGAVRDALLNRSTHDLDFVIVAEDVIRLSRQVANAIGAAFYPLDTQRDTARLILTHSDGTRQTLDFAALRAVDIESDLRARDFTINAMAIDLHPPLALVDPLGGAKDLHAGLLRACSPASFSDDPVRILRCVRQAADFGLQITPETKDHLRQAAPDLPRVSAERLRDELFRILEGARPGTALRALDIFGALDHVLPEVSALKDIPQSAPHTSDVWNHTLDVLQKLSTVLNVLALEHDPETAANWASGLIALRLGRYRQQVHGHLASQLNPNRSLRALIMLAALYHDSGKAQTRQLGENGNIRFLGHERAGERLVNFRARRLRLSNAEVARLMLIVRNHMRPLWLAQAGETPSRRAVYRFFRDCQAAGVDVCLLSLADTLGTYGPALPQQVWNNQLDAVRALLHAYWEEPEQQVLPPTLLTGNDLIQIFHLKPGPRVGLLLEALREAQAIGEVKHRDDALAFASAWLTQAQTPENQS